MTARAPGFIDKVRAAIAGDVRVDEPLARYSTFRIGGPATVVFPAQPEDVCQVVRVAGRAGVPWFVLGLGSNVLLPDEGLDAVVLRLGKGLDAMDADGERWTFGAGLPAPLAARKTAQAGWGGLHTMVGVPGTVGGGVYMNAGCHGAEWAQVVTRVTVADRTGAVRTIPRAEIPFAYRRSGLEDQIVLEVETQLVADSHERLKSRMNALFQWRQAGTPFNKPCCGSTFKNPALPAGGHPSGLVTAGQFLDAAGLKGFTIGGIQVSPVHANYFVNIGGGTASDVRRVMDHAQRVVADRFGVTLEPEVQVIARDGRVHG